MVEQEPGGGNWAVSTANLAIAFDRLGKVKKAARLYHEAAGIDFAGTREQIRRKHEMAAEFFLRQGNIESAKYEWSRLGCKSSAGTDVEGLYPLQSLHELHAEVSTSSDPHRRSTDGDSMLGYACQVGNIDAVRRLLEAGARPDQRMFTGRGQAHCTPLMRAAFYGRDEIVALLLIEGASRQDTDSQGNTAEQYVPYVSGALERHFFRIKERLRPEIETRQDEIGPTLELVEIAKLSQILNELGDGSFFWRPQGKGVGPDRSWHPRTREIGEQLYALGDGSLRSMLGAHREIVITFGDAAGHDLSAHWHGIGEREWQAGKGECWMH